MIKEHNKIEYETFENNSHEILERLIEHFEENLECIKKNEPVKNNLQWYWDIESYRR